MFEDMNVYQKRTWSAIIFTIVSVMLACTISIPIGGYIGTLCFVFGTIGAFIGLGCMGFLADNNSFQLFKQEK
jgi:hypothetical protein